MRGNSGRRRVESARRRTTWATVTQTISLAAANAYNTVDLLTQYKALTGETTAGCTIMRTHLRMAVTSAVTSGNNFTYGIIMGQNDDLGASPVAGAPKPATDLMERWQLWEWIYVDDFNSFGSQGAASLTEIIDLKSRRKMMAIQDSYNLVVQVQAATFPFTMQVTGRILLALP